MDSKPITWSYNGEDILTMEDECAACTSRGASCRTCTIARVLSECYMNELHDGGVDATLDDAFGMLFE